MKKNKDLHALQFLAFGIVLLGALHLSYEEVQTLEEENQSLQRMNDKLNKQIEKQLEKTQEDRQIYWDVVYENEQILQDLFYCQSYIEGCYMGQKVPEGVWEEVAQ
jgi:DNA repair ATPase RecN